jgi:hypothetical protein
MTLHGHMARTGEREGDRWFSGITLKKKMGDLKKLVLNSF